MTSAEWCPFCLGLNVLTIYMLSNFNKNKYLAFCKYSLVLTHWGQVTHICISKLTSIGSNNGLAPGRHWTSAGILFIHTLGTNFSEILSEIHTFSFNKIHLKMSSGKWRSFCLSLNVFMEHSASILNMKGYNTQSVQILCKASILAADALEMQAGRASTALIYCQIAWSISWNVEQITMYY